MTQEGIGVTTQEEATKMDAQAGNVSAAMARPASYRWLQLFMGIVCMAMIANLQYGWTLFVNPISDKVRLDARRDPGRLHDLRADGDLARAVSKAISSTSSGRGPWSWSAACSAASAG